MAQSRGRAGKGVGGAGRADGGGLPGLVSGRAEVRVKDEPQDKDAGLAVAAAARPGKSGKGDATTAKVGAPGTGRPWPGCTVSRLSPAWQDGAVMRPAMLARCRCAALCACLKCCGLPPCLTLFPCAHHQVPSSLPDVWSRKFVTFTTVAEGHKALQVSPRDIPCRGMKKYCKTQLRVSF